MRLNDIEGLAKAVAWLASDANLRRQLGEQGRELCLERFDWHTMVEQTAGVYRELARQKGIG